MVAVAQAKLVRGEVPDAFKPGYGDGSGYGDGYGYGYGYGSGSGDGSGSGCGCGSGSGCGSGDGCGYGSGDGSGCGDGYGSGSGDGYGSGYGSGSGYGYGDGYGYGYGSGSGCGDGYGYWLSVFLSQTKLWSEKQSSRLTDIWSSASSIVFWKSDKFGRPSNGGDSTKTQNAAPGVIHKSSGPLSLCSPGTLHGTMKPEKWKGERLWVVAMFGDMKWEDDKCGALEREILGEIK